MFCGICCSKKKLHYILLKRQSRKHPSSSICLNVHRLLAFPDRGAQRLKVKSEEWVTRPVAILMSVLTLISTSGAGAVPTLGMGEQECWQPSECICPHRHGPTSSECQNLFLLILLCSTMCLGRRAISCMRDVKTQIKDSENSFPTMQV